LIESFIIPATPAPSIITSAVTKCLSFWKVHYKAVRLTIRIRTEESDKRLQRLADLMARYCPVDSLVRAAVPDYQVIWERLN
jgi:hypothetical protein